MKRQKLRMADTILNNKRTAGGLIIPEDFNFFHNTVGIKPTWCGHKTRHVHQWTQIEDPDVNPYICTHVWVFVVMLWFLFYFVLF